MKVYLKKDVEKIGLSGEIIKTSDGYARNYLIPRGLGVEITPNNIEFYEKRARTVKNRETVISSNTSMLAEKIGALKLKIKRKMHDDGKLYGAISPIEIVELLAKEGITVSKSQVLFDKSIKSKGTHDITIKLTSRLLPQIKLTVISE